MNGYLMQDKQWTPGEDLFLESFSPESQNGVVFEDDGDAAYFYAVEKDKEGTGLRVLDALHIFETAPAGGGAPEPTTPSDAGSAATPTPGDDLSLTPGQTYRLLLVWSRDWKKCALVIGGLCHAIFDFGLQSGYNINEFPPPNEFWTKGDRQMTAARIRDF
ncbi:MAG TPA: DUF2251 domain-containing protein [Puia sp.]|jgi:hypothetical protein|nr:DUF2251 domain-containing protein [Puia sp.]